MQVRFLQVGPTTQNMYWYVKVFTDSEDEDEWTACAVSAPSERQAQWYAQKAFEYEGYLDVHYIVAVEFDDLEHGSLRDYNIIDSTYG